MSRILVIGGGVIGLLTARELATVGAHVTLIERGETGRESSWAGGGILSPLYPWRYADSLTALASWSQACYTDLCRELQMASGVDPECLPSGLLILDPEERADALAWAKAHQVRMERIEPADLAELEPTLSHATDGALWLPEIGQVRNPRFARALRRAVEPRVEVLEHQEVSELLVTAGRIQGVRTRQGILEADQVVVCAGAWTATLLAQLGESPAVEPVRGQMMVFLTQPGQIRHIVLYRDRYIIPRQDGHVLIGSTLEYTGFDKSTTAEAKEQLYRAAGAVFPLLRHSPIEHHWAGLRPGSPHGIPYIGAHPQVEGLFFNAGHFRNGVVTGPASARLAADLMLNRPPILDPSPYALHAQR